MAAEKAKKNTTQTRQIRNKKAWHNFEILEKVEAGISLLGTEVKSLRAGQGDLEGAYARILGNECWLVGCKITQYAQAGDNNHEPMRKRKLLLHKNQIHKITSKLDQRGFSMIPLKIYFNARGLAKVELGLATGKRMYDKRQSLKDKQTKMEINRSTKRYHK